MGAALQRFMVGSIPCRLSSPTCMHVYCVCNLRHSAIHIYVFFKMNHHFCVCVCARTSQRPLMLIYVASCPDFSRRKESNQNKPFDTKGASSSPSPPAKWRCIKRFVHCILHFALPICTYVCMPSPFACTHAHVKNVFEFYYTYMHTIGIA